MRALGRHAPATWAVAACAVVFGSCGASVATTQPAPAIATVPPGWVSVTTSTRDLQLILPPWLVPFDNVNAIFAKEPPAPGAEIPVQLFAQGPDRGAAFEFGGNPVGWIERRVSGPAQGVANPGEGIPAVAQVRLPAGLATRYERIDRVGTALEWRFLVFAIETPKGIAYLQVDGTRDGWRRRAPEFDWIARLLRAT